MKAELCIEDFDDHFIWEALHLHWLHFCNEGVAVSMGTEHRKYLEVRI